MWKFNKSDIKDHFRFEDLVLDFLKMHFPFINWVNRGYTRDNNADAVGTIVYTGEQIWAEAKYKYDNSKKLSSRRFDSTLISAALDENVIKIYFISNTFYNNELINRVSNFCYINNISSIVFVDRYSLETWITDHEEIQKKYFSNWKLTAKSEKSVLIQKLKILHKRDSFNVDNVESSDYLLSFSNNYRFQIEVKITGYECTKISLSCNDKDFYTNACMENGLHTFDITDFFPINHNTREIKIVIYFKENSKSHLIYREVLKFDNPLRFSLSQQKNLYKLEKFSLNSQCINLITGDSYVGKSEVMQHLKSICLYKATKNERIIFIKFKGTLDDIIYIAKMLLIIVYDFYEDTNYECFEKKCRSLKDDINGADKFDISDMLSYIADSNSSQLISLLLNICHESNDIFYRINRSTNRECIFFIDDVDILQEEIKRIFHSILKSFIPNRGVTIIYASRSIYLGYNKSFLIRKISQEDIIEGINSVFQMEISVDDMERIKKVVYSPLVLYSLLKNYEKSPTLETIYSFINNISPLEIYPLIFDNMLNEVICFVTIFKDGVNIDNLKRIYEVDVQKLLETRYVYIEESSLYSCIKKYNIDDFLYRVQKDKILEFINANMENDICYYGILLKLDNSYLYKNKEIIVTNLKELYWDSKYYNILYYYQDIYNALTGNTSIDIEIKYYYVMACMNCGKNIEVQEIFDSVDMHSIPLCKEYFLFLSEKIDYDYWQWNDLNNLIQTILAYCDQMEKYYSYKLYLEDWEVKRAYLTLHNRIMVTYLLHDDFENAKKHLFINILKANLFQSPEHIGYCLMDFAKGIYHIDLSLSKKLLIFSLNFFNGKKDIRRRLDCMCELQYIKILLHEDAIESFPLIYNQLKQYHYLNQYYKALLKECNLYILEGRNNEAKKVFTYFKTISSLENSSRNLYIIDLISKKLDDKISPINIASFPSNSTYLEIYDRIIKNNDYFDPRLW